MKFYRIKIGTTMLLMGLLFPCISAAHFPWIVLPESGSLEFSVVFSEGPWPDDPQYLARVGQQPVVAYSVDGQQPLANCSIKLVGDKFSDELSTNHQGQAEWKIPSDVEGTLLGCYAKSESTENGEHEGKKFSEVRNYLTMTLRLPSQVARHETGSIQSSDELTSDSLPMALPETETEPEIATETQPVTSVDLPKLPQGITSFGAARCNDAIYVYGGHTGEAHHYWNTSQSNELLKWDLTHSSPKWEIVATGPRLQGLGMVSHADYLIIVGGFTATNERDQPHRLVSQTDVKVFDTKSGQWTDQLNLPELPSGRSSHDAMIVNNQLYVVGGWQLQGDESTEWYSNALVANLDSSNPNWETLPAPGFHRRAITLVNYQDKLWVIGGMDRDSGPTLATSIFDPQTQQWSSGPDLIGESGMNGFGAAAWSLQGKLVVTAHDGSVQVLSNGGDSWIPIGYTRDARFFHRMLPLDDLHLVTLGGANMDAGKFLTPEKVSLER